MLGAGANFAGYRIERTLGQGGMGTVYLAGHPRLPRMVALKLLNREVSSDPELVRRFEREADVVARLEHPGIVGVLDRGTYDGFLWIAMQYIRGTDAASWDTSAQPPATVAHILHETALALDYAHSRGILHRDVKPANILISHSDDFRDSHAVLTDFGIAGLTDTTNTKLTATGTFTATLAYASPEQLSGEVVDHRSDQYSLACTLFALLAGQSPYAATNPGQVVMGHVSKPVPRISAIRPDLPAALDAVFAQAMAKQRDDRFSTCAGFITTALHALGGRHSDDTVDLARLAPTVRNARSAGYERPAEPRPQMIPTASDPASAPARSMPDPMILGSSPPGRGYPAAPAAEPRRNFPFISTAALGLVIVLVGVAIVIFLRSSTDEGGPKLQAWGTHQYIRDSFPHLIPEGRLPSDTSGKRVRCHTGENGWGKEIKCRHYDGSGIVFAIVDHSTLSAVQGRLNSSEFVGREIVSGPDITHPADTKTASHPELSAPAQVTVPPERSAASIYGDSYFSFPSDPVRGRFIINVQWPDHTADDILRDWWSQAPLGR